MAVLTARQLAAAPWGQPLLHEVHFTLAPGEVLAIIGPNGAGKSSLLHTLAGGIATSAGDVLLHDRPLRTWSRRARARALALLPQQSRLSFPFRAEDVILLGRGPHASGAAEDRSLVCEVMRATDTEALRDRVYTQLSGGERQRVQLARALAQIWRACDSPVRLLLLDEPQSGLDLQHQHVLASSVRQLAASGCAVVMVAHDFNFAAALAQRILVLQEGRQVHLGTPEQILTPDLFRDVFQAAVHILPHPVRAAPLVVPV